MNAVDVLMYGQREIEGRIGRLRADDWVAIALGVWTTKDLVGHLGAFEARFGDVLATFVGEPTQTDLLGTSPATFNDDQAAIRRDWPVDEVLSELRTAHQRVMDFAARVAPDTWREVGTIPWYGPQYALDDLVAYTMYGHKREHAPQLQQVLERSSR